MSEPDPIVDSKEGLGDSEVEVVKRSLGFEGFKLSPIPGWDFKRKMVLAKILPLLFCGRTYEEISIELKVCPKQVFEILKIYYKAVDQNELVDMHWWQLFFWAKKNKPELAFNALTAIKLKKMSLNAPTHVEEIAVRWLNNEQRVGTGNSLQAPMGSEDSSHALCTIQNAPLRTTLGQDDVGQQRSNPDDADEST